MTRPDRVGGAEIAYAPVRRILTRASGFLAGYDFTLNPYAGCSFGCAYCYAAAFAPAPERRESWGRWVTVKEGAVRGLERRRPGSLDGKRIYMSSVTDPYQPVERALGLTRRLLEVLADRHRPILVVQTRSPDVVRDCGLFRRIAAKGGRVQVNVTVTTDDEDVRRVFEPRCPGNPARLRAARALRSAGVETCITLTPLLLVRDAQAFADGLLETGVGKFVSQPFQFARGRFVAGTREPALRLMAQRLAAGVDSFRPAYEAHYREVRAVLRDRLPGLEEGKDGFRPPA